MRHVNGHHILEALALAALCSWVPDAAAVENRLRPVVSSVSYFPLAAGNTWTYRKTGAGAPSTFVVTAGQPQEGPVGSPSFPVSGYFLGPPRQLCVDGSGTVTERGFGVALPTLWYLLGAPVGASWELRLQDLPYMTPIGTCFDRAKLRVADRSATVTVPAGQFTGVVRLEWQTQCADAGITAEWFAPGVGLVRREEASFAGPVVSELLEATVGGTHWPRTLYSVSLGLDSPVYTTNRMPPGIGVPVVHGAFTVANESSQPVELTFGGCGSAIIEVVDAAGRVVITAHADDGGCCTCDRLEQIRLVHDTLMLPFAFKLEAPTGPLADGHYAVRARLVTPGTTPVIEATLAFEVNSIY